MDADKIIKVRHGNVVLRVPNYQMQEYLAKGYDVIDEDGKIIKHTTPSDINELKKAYVEHINKIEELETKLSNDGADDSVPQEDYDKLLDDYNALQDENEALKARVEELAAEIEASSKKKTTKK